MSSTQHFDVALPLDMAEAVQRKVQSGAYASVSDIVSEGIRALLDRETTIDQWLNQDVVAGHAEYLADPSKAVPADQVLGRIRARRDVQRTR